MKSITLRALASAACLLSLFGSAHAVQDCDIAGVGVTPANGNTTAGKTGLMRCRDRDSGVIQREQQVQNGAFFGWCARTRKASRSRSTTSMPRATWKARRGSSTATARWCASRSMSTAMNGDWCRPSIRRPSRRVDHAAGRPPAFRRARWPGRRDHVRRTGTRRPRARVRRRRPVAARRRGVRGRLAQGIRDAVTPARPVARAPAPATHGVSAGPGRAPR
jgi:hypothetical protein